MLMDNQDDKPDINKEKFPPLFLSIMTDPTEEMISYYRKEAQTFPPGRYRAAYLAEADRLEKRLQRVKELNKKEK